MYLLQTLPPFQIIKYSLLEGVHEFEILFGGKICNFISLYHSSSQSLTLSKIFELSLEKIAKKSPYLIAVLGYFNVKSSNWY